jgi:hypothetical protein
MWLKVFVYTAPTSGGAATIQAVLQDSPDNSVWTDRLIGTAIAVAAAVIGSELLATRMLQSHARYVRVVYRIGTAVLTAGTFISYLTPEQDVHDLSQRKATGRVTPPTGAADESFANGVLGS